MSRPSAVSESGGEVVALRLGREKRTIKRKMQSVFSPEAQKKKEEKKRRKKRTNAMLKRTKQGYNPCLSLRQTTRVNAKLGKRKI